jgi:putative transcriptional regulator
VHDREVTSSLKGRLLVAMPPLTDGNFDRTVVLLLEHGDEGALGVVLNRPAGVHIGEPLDRWASFVSAPQVYFIGGPVEPSAVIALALSREGGEHVSSVVGRVATVDLTADPLDVVGALQGLRLFHGYAGWGAGQLEDELSARAWIVSDFLEDDAFTGRPDGLWRGVLGRQPGRLGWLAHFPDDPSLN